MSTNIFKYGSDRLTAGIALDIVRKKCKGVIFPNVQQTVRNSHEAVRDIIKSGKTVYGINTGFGPLCTTVISEDETKKLQYNILKSHCVGVGEYISDEIVKLMLVLKLQSLCFGYSGINPETLERMIFFLDNDITPLVPSQGSVGASGDLAPLAHLFLPFIGLGNVKYKSEIVTIHEVYKNLDIVPLELGPKEGLALINGTQFIAAHAVKVIERMQNCLDSADIIGAMTLEAMLGSVSPFRSKIHEIRPFTGNKYVAERINCFVNKSEISASHSDCERVQDPYSIRCIPQVHGASRNAWLHLKNMLEVELNSVTDNPLIFGPNDTISGGNFHGQPLALPLDYSAIAASELGNISDRRTYLMLEGKVDGLPKLLMDKTGINSGFMLPQYTSAALVSENKGLCFPSSADSIPTSLGQEDHVSMGSISGRKANQVIDNLEKILAVELLCASQAFDFRKPLKSGVILEDCHKLVRKHIDYADEDRVFADDILSAQNLIMNKKLVEAANSAAESENINLESEYHELFGIY